MSSTPINIDLEDLKDIMDDLGDAPAGGEKRRNALTKEDILIIARVVQAVSHQSCAMGFEPEEIRKLKQVIKTVNGGILAVGYAILAAFGAGIVSVTIWAVKHGILEVAQNAQKGAGK